MWTYFTEWQKIQAVSRNHLPGLQRSSGSDFFSSKCFCTNSKDIKYPCSFESSYHSDKCFQKMRREKNYRMIMLNVRTDVQNEMLIKRFQCQSKVMYNY